MQYLQFRFRRPKKEQFFVFHMQKKFNFVMQIGDINLNRFINPVIPILEIPELQARAKTTSSFPSFSPKSLDQCWRREPMLPSR